MSVKVFAVTSDDQSVQIGSNWFSIKDAASDIRGGDFWSDLQKVFPHGCVLKEIRIVPSEPLVVEWERT